MPVRFLNQEKGGGNVRTAIGKADPLGAFTVVALVKRGVTEKQRLWSRAVEQFKTPAKWSAAVLTEEANGIRFNPGGTSAFKLAETGHWLFVVMVRPASGSKCKYYIFDYTTAEWTIKEDTAVSNITHEGAPTNCVIGDLENAVPSGGIYAACAVFNTAFTEAEAKALQALASIESWLTKAPLALWMFNQKSLVEPLKDSTGNGADQTSISGTEVIAAEPPVPYTLGASKPENVEAPVISGTLVVGEELAATTGRWIFNPTAFAYKWQEAPTSTGAWVTIAGATGPTLTLTTQQKNRFIRCIVTASNANGGTEANSNVLGEVNPSTAEEEGEEHGFPDWQEFPEYQPEADYTNPEVKIGAERIFGPFFVGQVPAIDLYIKQLAGNRPWGVKVVFSSRKQLIPPVLSQTFLLHPTAGELHQQVPCEARYVTVILFPLGGAGECTFEMRIQQTLAVVGERRFGDPVLFAPAPAEVLNATNPTAELTRTAPGPATWMLMASGVGLSRTVDLEKLNPEGVYALFFSVTLPENAIPVYSPIILPSSPVRMTFHNTSGATYALRQLIGMR
jgi:hypothetical protein